MRYKLLGNSGLRVSELCLGTMAFGEDWGWGASKEESGRIVDAFAEAGGNFIDTADAYTNGTSERYVGELISPERDRWVLATKYTLSRDPSDPNGAGNHRKSLVRALDASLGRLGTDYVDLLWVHIWDFVTPVKEVMRALDDQVRAGKVLYVGISDTPAWIVARANALAEQQSWTPFVAFQGQYSLVERTVERDLLPMCEALDLALTAWSPLGSGVLTGGEQFASYGCHVHLQKGGGGDGRDRLVAGVKALQLLYDRLLLVGTHAFARGGARAHGRPDEPAEALEVGPLLVYELIGVAGRAVPRIDRAGIGEAVAQSVEVVQPTASVPLQQGRRGLVVDEVAGEEHAGVRLVVDGCRLRFARLELGGFQPDTADLEWLAGPEELIGVGELGRVIVAKLLPGKRIESQRVRPHRGQRCLGRVDRGLRVCFMQHTQSTNVVGVRVRDQDGDDGLPRILYRGQRDGRRRACAGRRRQPAPARFPARRC